MILDATVAGRTIRVEVRGGDGRYRLTLDGAPLDVDLSGDARGLSSLLVGGESHEVGIEERDGGYAIVFPGERLTVDLAAAARGTTAPARHAPGPARLVAPMPGRVVRACWRSRAPTSRPGRVSS